MLKIAKLVSGTAGFRGLPGPSHLTTSPTSPPRPLHGLSRAESPIILKYEEGWGPEHTSAQKTPLAHLLVGKQLITIAPPPKSAEHTALSKQPALPTGQYWHPWE